MSCFWRALCIGLLCTQPAVAGEIVIDDSQLLVSFDTSSGAVLRFENKGTHWAVEGTPRLGASFELDLLPDDHKPDAILGKNQAAFAVEKISGQSARLQWKNLVDEHGHVLPITLTVCASVVGKALNFQADIENDSSVMIESVKFPFLGDLNRAPDRAPLTVSHMWYGNLSSQEVSKSPTVMSRQSLFCLIQSPKEGVCVEMKNPTQPYLVDFMFRPQDSVKQSSVGRRVEFFARHFIYLHPHSSAPLAPIALECYDGDWHAGVDIYKKWRTSWFKEPSIPAWIKQVNSWQQLQIDSPVQDHRVPYTNLIFYANQCAKNGVGAIQLVGWNHWGQDGGDPAQDTEPGLGSWTQLHDFIHQSQEMGVKIILFAKLNWADLTTEWYSNELYKYECTDPDGKMYEQGGYSYYTPAELAGYEMHRRAVMDFQDPAYRDVATAEFKKTLALGSAGWLWDEVCHHASVLYSWSPNHGYDPPGYIYGGDMPLERQLWAAADQVNTNFLFSGEGPEDWLMQYVPCSYFRITADSIPVCRYLDPQAPLVVAVTGFNDREKLNLCLLDRYIIEYEPYDFKGFLEDFPMTLAYGKQIDALRRKYADYIWFGTFKDTLGASVNSNGSIRYAVYQAHNGKRAVVLINTESSKIITASVKLPNSGRLMTATPENPGLAPTNGTLKINPRSAVVVMEQ